MLRSLEGQVESSIERMAGAEDVEETEDDDDVVEEDEEDEEEEDIVVELEETGAAVEVEVV